MTTDGERAPRIGEQFRNSAKELLKHLGYQEVFSGNMGLDFVAEVPPTDYKFNRPCFSPNGVTAFEFTAETGVNIRNRRERLRDVINTYNSLPQPQCTIEGGVLVVDTKIGNSIIEESSNSNVYCWDHRHLNFLTAKCRLWSDWIPEDRRLRSTHGFSEREVDSMITSFKVIKPMEGFHDVYIAIFHHSPIAVLSISEAHRFLTPILEPIKANANKEALDTVLHLQMHVAGEIESGLLYDFTDTLTNYVDDFVRLQEESCRINYYGCAPWASFLPQR